MTLLGHRIVVNSARRTKNEARVTLVTSPRLGRNLDHQAKYMCYPMVAQTVAAALECRW